MTDKQTLWILCAALLAPVGLVPAGCSPGAHAAGPAPAPSVAVAPVRRATIVRDLNIAGQFEPYQEVDVHAKVSGYVRSISVDIGDRVRRGQVLAVLEVPELSAQYQGTVAEVAQTRDEILRCKNEVARAESQDVALHANYRRLKEAAAAQPGLIAQQELDDAQAKDSAAAAAVDAARAALAAAKQQAAIADDDNQRVGALDSYTRVTAPLNGVIVWRYADTGDLIQAGTSSDVQSMPLVKLAQSDLLRLRFPVPEDAVRFIHAGTVVQVKVASLDRSFTGRVVRFTRDVSLATRTMQTEVDVPNHDLAITPGMYARGTIELERRVNVPAVPAGAVMEDDAGAKVLVVDGRNRVEPRRVRLGLQGTTRDEILSGVKEGDYVILGGQAKYRAGEIVHPVLPLSSTAKAGGEPVGGGR